MKTARNIIVKTCLTADNYLDLVADAEAAGKSHSTLLRDAWLSVRNLKAPARAPGRTRTGQQLAKFAPGRSVRSQMHAFRS